MHYIIKITNTEGGELWMAVSHTSTTITSSKHWCLKFILTTQATLQPTSVALINHFSSATSGHSGIITCLLVCLPLYLIVCLLLKDKTRVNHDSVMIARFTCKTGQWFKEGDQNFVFIVSFLQPRSTFSCPLQQCHTITPRFRSYHLLDEWRS